MCSLGDLPLLLFIGKDLNQKVVQQCTYSASNQIAVYIVSDVVLLCMGVYMHVEQLHICHHFA